MNRIVLITGFGPFGGIETNPSEGLARRLDGRRLYGRTVVGEILPVEFAGSTRVLRRLIRRHQPELVVCLGVAPSRVELSVERVAINLADARLPDNAGDQPRDRPIVKTGPAAYFSRLPVKAMVGAMKRKGVAAHISTTAGTYVCNHVFYRLMHELQRSPHRRGGFVHVPPVSARVTLDQMEVAIAGAVTTALRTKRDARVSGGSWD